MNTIRWKGRFIKMGKYNSLTAEEQANYLVNKYSVTKIKLYETIQHFCPLGDQVGTTSYEMIICPGEQLAELCELHSKFTGMIGTTYSLESGLGQILEILKEAYPDAWYIGVTAKCPTNKHMACDAVAEYYREDEDEGDS